MSDPSAAAKWSTFLDGLAWQKGSLDASSYEALLRAGTLGIEQGVAIAEVSRRIVATGTPLRTGKILQQAQRAYAFAAEERLPPGASIPPLKPKPAFDPAKLERLASRLPEPADWPKTLAAISPLRPDTQSPTKILRELYKAGERVIVFTGDQQSQGNYLFECPRADETLRPIPEEYLRHDEGVWFLVQPVDGDTHANPRTGNASRRSEEAVTSWRYAVLESDSAPWRKWLAALVQLPLPIAAIYSSGGRSIHALVLIEADSKSQWDEVIRDGLLPILATIGADPQALTAIRLSRLPNAWRGARKQTLIFLDPQPDGKSIWDKYPRESSAPSWRDSRKATTGVDRE